VGIDAFAARPPQHANSIEHIGRRLVPPTLEALGKKQTYHILCEVFQAAAFFKSGDSLETKIHYWKIALRKSGSKAI